MIAIFRGPQNPVAAEKGVPKTNDLALGFSRDGFHWDRPDRRAFIPATRAEGTWDKGYIHAAGGVCLVVGDLLYFYYAAWSGESPKLRGSMVGSHAASNAMYAGGSTGLATLRGTGSRRWRPGWREACSPRGPSPSRTAPVRQRRHLAGRAAGGGAGPAGEVVAPFSAGQCVPVSADGTAQRGGWTDGGDLSALRGTPVRFRFHVTSGSLYTFWVSRDTMGSSNGYSAAGAP